MLILRKEIPTTCIVIKQLLQKKQILLIYSYAILLISMSLNCLIPHCLVLQFHPVNTHA